MPGCLFRFYLKCPSVVDSEENKLREERDGRGTEGGGGGGGGPAEEGAFDYQQQCCSNVFMSVTHKWGSAHDKIGLKRLHTGRLVGACLVYSAEV